MSKLWRLLPSGSNNLVSQLLVNRGVLTPDQANWREPKYERDLHDPFLMKDMAKAVELIVEAIKNKVRIAVFADYDADGVPGAVVLTEWFKYVGYTDYEVYIPDRHDEDYGLSVMAVEQLAKAGAKLLITIDCGITNVVEVARAKELGMEVIVTDHHLVPAELPQADAILNPKQSDDNYPEKMLCGTGVVFKLVQGLLRRRTDEEIFVGVGARQQTGKAAKISLSGRSLDLTFGKWLLDLVAIATIGDMVPLRGENRALAYFGLKVLRRTRRPGLISFYRVLGLDPRYVSEDDVGFSIAPRINSASRMTHASEAYDLLSADDPVRAMALAEHLEKQNKERKKSVEKIMVEMAIEENLPELNGVIVAGSESWNLGVLGLAAARLAEKYGRPTFLWGKNGHGLIKGSCRSNGLVDIVALMREAGGEKLFTNFGGHAAAGGFSVSPKQVAALTFKLNKAYATLVEGRELPSEELLLDAELLLDRVDEATCRLLESLAPWGVEYPKPLFFLPRLHVKSNRLFGGDKTHLELELLDGNYRAKAIGFFLGNKYDEILRDSKLIDLAAHLETSYFRGRAELRLRIVDLRPAQ